MYVVYIVLFIILLVLLLFTSYNEGYASELGYLTSSQLPPPNNNCLDFVVKKGWIDPNDPNPYIKERMDVLSDMQVSRVPNPVIGNMVYPNINACTISSDSLKIYNAIDPKTCVMRGSTIQGKAVHKQLQKIDEDTLAYPKGCMINLDNKDAFMEFLDDAYQLKNFNDIKERSDQKGSMIALSDHNLKLKNQYEEAQQTSRAYKEELDKLKSMINDVNVDGLNISCRDDFTEWNDTGNWSYNYLDRHPVECRDGEVLTQFQVQTSYKPDKTRYKYRCCKVDSAPVRDRLREYKSQSSTPWNNSLNWNTTSLTTHYVHCPNRTFLKGFKLEPQYNDRVTSQAKINFTCGAFDPALLIGRKMDITCRNVQTGADQSAPTFNYLDRHNITCRDDEALTEYGLKSTGNKFYYDYKCCKPQVVAK